MAITKTAIGRVIPAYVGDWSALTDYKKLDNVLYNGNTYVALVDNNGKEPGSSQSVGIWQIIASKGDSGTIATVSAIAYTSESAYVAVNTSGPSSNIAIDFEFGLPKGDTGAAAAFSTIVATATSVAWNDPAYCSATISGPPTATTINFDFGIPRAQGEGISLVDGYGATGTQGNVILTAVQYGRNQTVVGSPIYISDEQAAQARANIRAAIDGNYITEPSDKVANQFLQYDGSAWSATTVDYIADPSVKTVNYFLQYLGNDEWTTSKIDVFPVGGEAGYYLRKTSNATEWAPVQALPSGGAMGAPLVKSSVADYAVTWGSFITNAEIDSIIDD